MWVENVILEPVCLLVERCKLRFHPVGQGIGQRRNQAPRRIWRFTGFDHGLDIAGRLDRLCAQGDQQRITCPHAQGQHVLQRFTGIQVHAAQVDQEAMRVPG